jgi:hypothetical protein
VTSTTAGNEVDAWCTKCRMDLNHRVVAAVAGRPKRVECLTCHTQHNYRAPKGIKDPIPKGEDVPVPTNGKKSATSKAPKAPKVTKAVAARTAEWDRRVLGQLEQSFKQYSPKTVFKTDELLRHPKFGDGFVATVDPDGKIAVIFRDGEKTLIHAR